MNSKKTIEDTHDLMKEATIACKQALVYVATFSFFVNVLMLTVPLYMLQLFDRVLAGRSTDTPIYLTMIAIAALGTFALLDITRSRVMVKVSRWLDNYLSPKALLRCPDEILNGQNYGSYALQDINKLRQFIGSTGIFSLFDSPWVPIYLAVIFLLHPILGGIATIGAIILFTIAYLNESLTNKPLASANKIAMRNQSQTDAAVRNAEVIQAMGMMPNIIKSWFRENEKVLDLQVHASNQSAMLISCSKFFRLVLQLLMLGTGAFLVIHNSLTSGGMIAGSILLGRALAPVEQAIGFWKQFLSAKESYFRLQSHFKQKHLNRHSGIQLPEPKGFFELEKVYFVPKGLQRPTLQNINLKIQPGEFHVLIGPSAAGKSTIVKLLVGAWHATNGDVRLDGADVFNWERTDFGRHIGYMPQDVELFIGTIKQNIARMGIADDAAIIEAAKLADVHDLILHLPDGYDTEIMGAHFQLSGGQRQRIALARALYKNPKILVLDEPNSNLDSEGELALTKTLQTVNASGATIIVVSHRPNLLRLADKITMIANGQIQYSGPRDKILEQLQKAMQAQSQAVQTSQGGDSI